MYRLLGAGASGQRSGHIGSMQAPTAMLGFANPRHLCRTRLSTWRFWPERRPGGVLAGSRRRRTRLQVGIGRQVATSSFMSASGNAHTHKHLVFVAARTVAGEPGSRLPHFGRRPPRGSMSHVSSVGDHSGFSYVWKCRFPLPAPMKRKHGSERT